MTTLSSPAKASALPSPEASIDQNGHINAFFATGGAEEIAREVREKFGDVLPAKQDNPVRFDDGHQRPLQGIHHRDGPTHGQLSPTIEVLPPR